MRNIVFFSILLFFVSILNAQDTQYWTRQIGTRSALMGGSVIASSRDNTALLYNPANLAWVDTSAISINGNLFGNEKIKIENALGQRGNFKSSHFGSVPLLVGGMLRTRSQSLRIAYGVMAQSSFNFSVNARAEGNFPLVDDAESPGNEGAIGQLSLASDLSEQAAGIGVGKQLNKHFSVGLTGLFIVRSHKYSRYQLTRVYMNQSNDPLITSSIIEDMKYYNIRFQPKLALSYQKAGWTAGLTVGIPSVRLFGNGSINFDATGTHIKPAGYTDRIDFVANDRQVKLKSKYKSPLSIAGGLGYTVQRSHFELSLQYFNSIDIYSVLQGSATAFARPANAYPDLTSDKYLRVLSAAKPVLNAGLAWEYQLKPRAELYVSLRTDNTYFDKSINEQAGLKPDISSWDIFHVVVGTTLHRGQSALSIGIATAFGKDDRREQTGNISGDTESNFFQGTTTITKASYSAIGLLLGYTYNFKKF